jgi:excisionase family DNA binding protein
MPDPNPTTRHTYSPREVAAALGVHRSTVQRMCHRGELEHLRVGDRILIPAAELDALLKQAERA